MIKVDPAKTEGVEPDDVVAPLVKVKLKSPFCQNNARQSE